jgi:hypothetical protein
MSQQVTHHQIKGTNDLLKEVITDQAASIVDGWREALQNGIDSDSDTVILWYDSDKTIVYDDGSGVDISKEYGRKLITELGNSSKNRNDDDTIGVFGIGKGQIIAKGRTVFISKGTALFFNILGWGVRDVHEVPLKDIEDHANYLDDTSENDTNWTEVVEDAMQKKIERGDSGLIVAIDHYDDETPNKSSYKWDKYESKIKKRFKYLNTDFTSDTEIIINDKLISGESIENGANGAYNIEETIPTETGGNAKIAVSHGQTNSLSVYSNGIFVKNIKTRGMCGEIVTGENLKLNFARNDIQSGCDTWESIESTLEDIRIRLFDKVPGERLCSESRYFIAQKLNEGVIDTDEWIDCEIFKLTNDQLVSIRDIKSRSEVGFANPTDKAADSLTEAYDMIVLSQGDKATKTLQDNYSGFCSGLPDTFSTEQKANELGVHNRPEVMSISELSPRQRQKLGVARELAKQMGIERTIRYGKADGLHAWTDASSYIAITDTAADASKWVCWVPQLYETIIHEYTHTRETTEGCASHGSMFNSRFRKNCNQYEEVRSSILREIDENGIREYDVR